jgi:hypothetical protein
MKLDSDFIESATPAFIAVVGLLIGIPAIVKDSAAGLGLAGTAITGACGLSQPGGNKDRIRERLAQATRNDFPAPEPLRFPESQQTPMAATATPPVTVLRPESAAQPGSVIRQVDIDTIVPPQPRRAEQIDPPIEPW